MEKGVQDILKERLPTMARNVRHSHNYSTFTPRRFFNRIWCRDFTIICITKKLDVKVSAYPSFFSDVHKSYRVEKIVLHSPDIFTYQT